MKKYIYKIGVFFLSLPFLGVTASCDDWFGIMPQSEMVAEDFWKDEQDVKSAVGACYRAMLEDGFMRRLVVWGELRSDNVINGLGTDTEIGYILNANLNEANSYCKWNDFYTVINYCNTVIHGEGTRCGLYGGRLEPIFGRSQGNPSILLFYVGTHV